ncbi:unnamed protein product [Caenorhabditis nigoni]
MKFKLSDIILIFIVVHYSQINAKSYCRNGTIEMYSLDGFSRDSIDLNETQHFQLFGEEVTLVKRAFLSTDSVCHVEEYPLKMMSVNRTDKRYDWNHVREFRMDQEMRSQDERTNFFFCTEPRATEFSQMVKIPEGQDFQMVYLMMPLLALCLIMSATFSGLNLAIMSFSINDLKLIQGSDSNLRNRQRAGDVLRLRRHSNYVLVTIIFGNCFCNTSITLLLNYFGDVYGFGEFGYVELTATILLLIFTEILPSLIFTKNALPIASGMQYFVIFAMIVTMPISYPLSKLLDRILGKENADEAAPMEVDSVQLVAMIDEKLDDGEVGMMNVVQRALDLRKKRAEDVMTPITEVEVISEDMVITKEFLTDSFDRGFSRLPVHDKDNENKICGVLNLFDAMLLMDDQGRGLTTDLTAGTLLSVLEKRRKHCFVLNSLPVQQFMIELQRGCTMAIVVQYLGDKSDVDAEERLEELEKKELEKLKAKEETDVEVEEDESEKEKEKMAKALRRESYQVIGIITMEDYMEEVIGEIMDEKDKKEVKT